MPPPLSAVVPLDPAKLLNPETADLYGGITAAAPVLVVLAAGKGTRFGANPKCIQPVSGVPLARHSIDSFRRVSASPAICLVGYKHEEVSAALGLDNLYVRSENPAGGTAFAAFEAFCCPGLLDRNPLLIVTMGDRIVPPSIYRLLAETHAGAGREATLTFLSAVYEPPRNRGKGRVIREAGRVRAIREDRDIAALPDGPEREAQLALTEGNCPLYAVRAATLHRYLGALTNDNAQGQYYLTDIIAAIASDGGEIRTITTTVADPGYDLLCSDVTQPLDLALLEGIVAARRDLLFPDEAEAESVAKAIAAGRPVAQIASIARQLRALAFGISREKLPVDPNQPAAIGISGGRLRIAFMHPDMARFFGPAWQMPIGAGDPFGEEQIVVLTQEAADRRLHLFPSAGRFRESINSLPSDGDDMFPGDDITDLHSYEAFGTRLSETLLLQLGYFSDEEVARRRDQGLPLPPSSLWVSNSMRRPFALVGNAIASLRTLRTGNLGARVQRHLGRDGFRGLRLVTSGDIPQGGFSSSSAVTVATKNAINALFELGIPADLLVHLACQAEYGTGVRAGSLDQATEQKGRSGEGTLISSNPRENYKVLATHPVPTSRIQMLFPYTVDRDRAAWQWSWGFYGQDTRSKLLTPGEMRKLTGKAAEMAAILVRLPGAVDFFQSVQADLLETGSFSLASRRAIAEILLGLPLSPSREELEAALKANRDWFAAEIADTLRIDAAAAEQKADAAMASLFAGWRAPEGGVPLRAMLAYLFAEVARNFALIHDQAHWTEWVARSQRGDRCFDIDPQRLPARAAMEEEHEWDAAGAAGPERLAAWMRAAGATPYDYNAGLDDASLSAAEPPDFRYAAGGSFFRGLALIDLAEAMLHRAFGPQAVAVRVNAAGQGDYFQVHVDREKADPAEVKRFLRAAFYRRFGLTPNPEFVEVHPGGGAAGVRLSSYQVLGPVLAKLDALAHR